jgi:glycerol 3-phosphatase-2
MLKSSDDPLVDVYDCAMLDLDGVVYVGQSAVPGAPELLARVRDSGVSLAYVTNNAARTPDAVAAHLTELGVDATPQDVVTSAQAAARAIASKFGTGAKVLVAGGEGLLVALDERGLDVVTSSDDEPAAVVQGFHPSVGWTMLAEATYAIRAGAYWVASNLDLTVPTARGVAPGNGSLVNVVATTVGRQPDLVAGKPFRPLFDETVLRIQSRHPIVVGDRLDTDIEGARNCGADSLLVMTGVTDVNQLCHAAPHRRPDYVSWTLAGLMTNHAAPELRDGGWVCGQWRAHVHDSRLVLSRQHGSNEPRDPSADGLRAATAAAWTWLETHPDLEVETDQAAEALGAAR